jgi:siroheme synthase-like protein
VTEPGPVPPPRYALFVDLAGAPCLVVGGGTVAERRTAGLLHAGARVTVVAPDLTAGLRARHDAGEVTVLAEAFRPAHLHAPAGGPWRLVVAATSDRAVNAEVAAAGHDLGVWVNDASDPAGGAVTVPAVARVGAVAVAVTTGGVSPGAAAWLRDLLAGAVPAEVAQALDLLAEVTAEVAAEVAAAGSGGRRPVRADWRTVLDSGMLVDIREGHRAVAKERLKACLSSSSD